MNNRVLPVVEDRIRQYQEEHRGERPLYIIVASDEAESLMNEVKQKEGIQDEVMITEYQGSKIVSHMSVKPGEIRLTNELPDTGS